MCGGVWADLELEDARLFRHICAHLPPRANLLGASDRRRTLQSGGGGGLHPALVEVRRGHEGAPRLNEAADRVRPVRPLGNGSESLLRLRIRGGHAELGGAAADGGERGDAGRVLDGHALRGAAAQRGKAHDVRRGDAECVQEPDCIRRQVPAGASAVRPEQGGAAEGGRGTHDMK